jgi:hypothetical protein
MTLTEAFEGDLINKFIHKGSILFLTQKKLHNDLFALNVIGTQKQ